MLSGENNTDYRLIIIHLIGVDHAAHNYGSNGYNEVQRKLNDTEIIIKNTIEKMDNDTVLLIFGDHGMTDGGTHGGSSDKEIRSALLSYSKRGFPLKALSKDLGKHSLFVEDVNPINKQIDIAAIISDLLNLPLPFSNMGVLHPWFHQSTNLSSLYQRMLAHLDQLQTYVHAYCGENGEQWCVDIYQEIISDREEFSKIMDKEDLTDAELMEHIVSIHGYMNKQYQVFRDLWIDFEELSILEGIFCAFLLLYMLL